MAADLPIAKLLRECGYASDAAQTAARAAIEAAGLTRPGKARIAAAKRPDVEAALRARVTLLCDACRAAGLGDGHPEAIAAGAGDRCAVCQGSSNRRSALLFIRACERAGLRRVIFIGGSPDIHRELPVLLGEALDVRVVDGTIARPGGDVRRELGGCDLAVVLGSTELNHTVSAAWSSTKTIATSVRGISAFLAEASEKVAARADRGG